MDRDRLKIMLKKTLSNPNTLTFILMIGLVLVVYFVYDGMVKRAISPVTLPYAVQKIPAETKITQEMIGSLDISGTFIANTQGQLIQNRMNILDRWVAKGYQIVPNSFFFQDAISTDNEDDKGTDFDNIPDGYTIYPMETDFHETYGCSIMSGNYIDLYLKSSDEDGKIIFELFIKSIQVSKVADANFNDVFTNPENETGQLNPKYLYFIVPIEQYELLKRIELIGNIELVPVPRNAGYSENPEETEIVNQILKDYIDIKSDQETLNNN